MTDPQTNRPAPLDGVRVVTIAPNIPGPVAAARLAGLGAQVTTVLPPPGDPLQLVSPTLFDLLHEGQSVRTLDLKDAAALQDLERLLGDADLLITSHRARALVRLGLDFDSVATRHPRLCQIDIVGHPGDAADLPGHDLTYQAANGLLAPEQMPSTLVADLTAAEQAATAALAVLRLRDRDGFGARQEVAISEAAKSAALPLAHGLTGPRGPLGGGYPLYAVYAAADGNIALAALEPQFRDRVLQVFGLADAAGDLRRLGQELGDRFAEHETQYWEAWGQEHDVPLAPLNDSRLAAHR